MIPYFLLVTAINASCIFQLPDGKSVDLSKLQLYAPPDYQVFSLAGFLYVANICGETFMSCNGDSTGVAAQWIGFSNCIAVLARKSSRKNESYGPAADYIDSQNKNRGIVVSYYNGDICLSLGFTERKVLFELVCDLSVDLELMDVIEFPTCVYTYKFRSKYSCTVQDSIRPVYNPEIDITAQVPKPAKTSWTKTFLILLGISALLYAVLRSVRNKYNSESIPLSNGAKSDRIKSIPSLLISTVRKSLYKCKDLIEIYILRTQDYQDLS